MWLLFHRNAKTRVVRDGHSFVETCPECGRRARFDEVEVSESFGVFFVDVLTDRERKYRCGACGDIFDLRDQPDAPAVRAAVEPPRKTARELAGERAEAEARRLEAAQLRREREEARANRIEDELAELKKRMGR
jgi:rubredoxin